MQNFGYVANNETNHVELNMGIGADTVYSMGGLSNKMVICYHVAVAMAS